MACRIEQGAYQSRMRTAIKFGRGLPLLTDLHHNPIAQQQAKTLL
jgi:hypothetical protein